MPAANPPNILPQDIHLRAATAADEVTIKRLVRQARLDPTSLKWLNFMVAEHEGRIVAIGQVKPYPGCQEIGSLVTLPRYRGLGIASRLMSALENRAGKPLYLLCLQKIVPFYEQRGYETITWLQAPAFLKLKLSPTLIMRLFGMRVRVMVKK
ncbi:MAG: GNAT family N-acetyltransferase [Anaerolineaceae bacterium]|nr:GNAT family N-acetyltransferase [Anaerolineaceae bacterium]